MAFELPFPPFPHDSRDVPFIAIPDDNNGHAVPSSQYFKKLVGEKYLWTPVSADDPMPTSDATSQAKLAEILAKISADPATQTTLKAILDKIIAAPATEAKQTALNALIGEAQAAPTANTMLARLKSLEDKIDAITSGTTPAVTQLSGRKLALPAVVDYGQTLNIAPTNGVFITVTPPIGEIWRLKLLDITIPAPDGATSGYHYGDITLGIPARRRPIMRLTAAFGDSWGTSKGAAIKTHANNVPSTEAEQRKILSSIEISNACPLTIAYYNYTDVAQTGTAVVDIIKEVEYIV